jgi:hypothetical protein
MPDAREQALEALARLHAAVDAAAAGLAARHAARMRCRLGCSACCIDEIRVFEVEAERIRRAHPRLLAEGVAGPVGACAFLDAEGGCRVYAERPYVCRTQGLPLRWFDDARGEEHRDICPLNEPGGPPIEELRREECWPLGPVEDELRALQARFAGRSGEVRAAELRRVPLRSLFSVGPEGHEGR